MKRWRTGWVPWVAIVVSWLGGADPVGADARDPSVLVAGDVIRVVVYQHNDLERVLRIAPTGEVSIPLVGQVRVAGMTPLDAQEKIATRLDQGGFANQPQVSLTVEHFYSGHVSILGKVNNAGRYRTRSPGEAPILTLVDLVAVAGGRTADGGDLAVITRAGTGQVEPVDLEILLRDGITPVDLRLGDGDRVFVPIFDRFFIHGEVRNPGAYRFESGMTVVQALAEGGGISERGTVKGLKIHRRNDDGKVEELDLGLDEPLVAGDVIFVKESVF